MKNALTLATLIAANLRQREEVALVGIKEGDEDNATFRVIVDSGAVYQVSVDMLREPIPPGKRQFGVNPLT